MIFTVLVTFLLRIFHRHFKPITRFAVAFKSSDNGCIGSRKLELSEVPSLKHFILQQNELRSTQLTGSLNSEDAFVPYVQDSHFAANSRKGIKCFNNVKVMNYFICSSTPRIIEFPL